MSTPLLDEIRLTTESAHAADSSSAMIEQVQSREPADYVLIQIGSGQEWLTTRLFIAAVMLERMRGVKVVVFVEKTQEVERRFIAVANVQQLRWRLARAFPWLHAALVKAEATLFQYDDPKTTRAATVLTETGAMEPHHAQQLVRAFLAEVQERGPLLTGSPAEWQKFATYAERSEWVTRRILFDLLPSDDFEACIAPNENASRPQRSRAMLRKRAPFVALVGEDRRFRSLINRRKYLDEVASSLGEEAEAAPS